MANKKKTYVVMAMCTKYWLTDGDQEEEVLRTTDKEYAESEVERINRLPYDQAWLVEE